MEKHSKHTFEIFVDKCFHQIYTIDTENKLGLLQPKREALVHSAGNTVTRTPQKFELFL